MKARIIAVGLLVMIAYSLFLFVEYYRIDKHDKTMSAITETAYRVHLHVQAHGIPPEHLSMIEPLDGHINRTEDAWGNSLKYSYDNTGLFRLESLGANGLLGGEGDNRDVARSFRWQNESGGVLSDEAFWASERSIP